MQETTASIELAVCVEASADSDLRVGKVYLILPDEKAGEVNCLRVVDESGEDYLYPASRFLPLQLPVTERERLLEVLSAAAA